MEAIQKIQDVIRKMSNDGTMQEQQQKEINDIFTSWIEHFNMQTKDRVVNMTIPKERFDTISSFMHACFVNMIYKTINYDIATMKNILDGQDSLLTYPVMLIDDIKLCYDIYQDPTLILHWDNI